MGPNPISFAEIEAWARLTRTPLQPHHVEILVAIDGVWIQRAYDRPPEGTKIAPRSSGQAISAALFDAAMG